jgi:hypothetical protein
MRTRFFIPTVTALTAALLAPAAHATGEEQASPTGKGIVGGALLGAEAVMLIEAAADVRPAWAYVVGGLAGAAAGGVGGFFVEDSDDARASLLLLAGGMALAIPTTVAVLSVTAYRPPANYVQDQAPPPDEPVAEPPQPAGTPAATPPPTSRAPVKRRSAPAALYRTYTPPALVGMGDGALTLSVPAVVVKDAYTRRELFEYGVKQTTEVRVPVFNFAF